MSRPGFDDSETSGGGDDGTDSGLVGYVQESDDGTGFLMASANEDDIYTADGGREDHER